ncbi:MAG: H-NS histone family protein [Paucibacter sp.]|nr:H-NS histone family protein [Roseateles sp.]
MQAQVVKRIRKEIEHYQLTPDHLFGEASPAGRVAKAIRATSRAVVKYADGLGNTWGGMGKRPTWLRQALEAGRQLEEFLVGKHAGAAAKPARKAAAKKRGPARKAAAKTAAKTAAKPARKAAAKKAKAPRKTATKRVARKRAASAPAASTSTAA